jgi:hypothetical protein
MHGGGTVMSDLAQVEIERDVADAAARRAAEQGVTLAAYISSLLRRSFERASDEQSVLAYNHVDDVGDVVVDREANEDEESHRRRSALYGTLFGRSG